MAVSPFCFKRNIVSGAAGTGVPSYLLALMMLEYEDQADLLEKMLSTDIFTTEMAPTEYGRKVQKKYDEMFDSPGTTIAVLGCEGTSALLEVPVSCGK